MIMEDGLPGIKSFLRSGSLTPDDRRLLRRMMAGFLSRRHGRMSASHAATAVRSDSCHRAQLTRPLAASSLGNSGPEFRRLARMLLSKERRKGKWLLILDKTCSSRQGARTPNTCSTGNRKRRPAKGRRYNKKKHAPRRCHAFVFALLISPSGYRVASHRCYYTREYCAAKKLQHRTEAELGAELVRTLQVPEGADVTVLGDTAYESEEVRTACAERAWRWIMPANPERVLAGAKPRPKLSSRLLTLNAAELAVIRLMPGKGAHVAQRRVARCRIGPKAKPRTFYAHKERLQVHSVGEVQVVFSMKEKPQNDQPLQRDQTKILMSNDPRLSLAEIVELYDLRWQIELFFKELKSVLGFGQYRFLRFEAVESWVECCVITYLYLEWHRATRLASRRLSCEAKRWWSHQRTHGLCQAVHQQTETKELVTLADWTRTASGLRKLKRLVRCARPTEYRIPA